ncbi:hypothetical protein BLNAU_11371 [Blattamonas nauphoetae]|uniref:Uncharacterized protein n=1 Tax=Blattamonas nauphoetae TaxID=2049346 RepID=A0ABQ9XSM1_9EUKA|nr:hypothetical protein BLNAU_11371 [Blattamonas nauphoetae]
MAPTRKQIQIDATRIFHFLRNLIHPSIHPTLKRVTFSRSPLRPALTRNMGIHLNWIPIYASTCYDECRGTPRQIETIFGVVWRAKAELKTDPNRAEMFSDCVCQDRDTVQVAILGDAELINFCNLLRPSTPPTEAHATNSTHIRPLHTLHVVAIDLIAKLLARLP